MVREQKCVRVGRVCVWQRHHHEVGALPGFEAAALVGPAERFGAGERDHSQQLIAGEVRVSRPHESRFGEDVEIGVGREAVGAEAHANPAREELAERVRRVPERRVCAGTVDDGLIRAESRVGREGFVCVPTPVTVLGFDTSVNPGVSIMASRYWLPLESTSVTVKVRFVTGRENVNV